MNRSLMQLVGVLMMMSGAGFALYGHLAENQTRYHYGLLCIAIGGSIWLLMRGLQRAQKIVDESEAYWGEHGPL